MPEPRSPLVLGVLISGGGTTLANLLRQGTEGRLQVDIPVVIADRECAGAIRAREAGLRCDVLPRSQFSSAADFSEAVFTRLRDAGVQLVVLGGFLARVEIPADFSGRVMNIHPALIPAFSGQGMYGRHVHQAVLARGCRVSGCTVHFADNEYDHGPIILQRCVPVEAGDTPSRLAARVFEAECEAYPEAIRLFAAGRLAIDGQRVVMLPESPPD